MQFHVYEVRPCYVSSHCSVHQYFFMQKAAFKQGFFVVVSTVHVVLRQTDGPQTDRLDIDRQTPFWLFSKGFDSRVSVELRSRNAVR